MQLVHERLGALAGLLELLAEVEDRLGRLRRLVAVEQRLAVLELADRARGRVEAQRQLVAVLAQARQQEREAAQIGRDIDVVSLGDALFVEEGVGALVKAHQRDRHRAVADREDDREMALDHGELVDRHRNGVGRGDPVEAVEAANLEIAVAVAVERLEAVVKKRQHVRRLARHGINSENGAGRRGNAHAAGLLRLRWQALVAGPNKRKAFEALGYFRLRAGSGASSSSIQSLPRRPASSNGFPR